jgi:YD repeat-containing protein
LDYQYHDYRPLSEFAWYSPYSKGEAVVWPGLIPCGNRLDSFQNVRYRHDARGNVVKKIYGDDVYKRTFNAFNQMVAYEAPDGSRTEYAYDALGRRILKKSGTKETRFYWDQFHLCGEQTGIHRTQYVNYPNSFTPMCCIKDDKAFFFIIPIIWEPQWR